MAIGPSGPDEPLDLGGHIEVPDDASSLEADRLALLAELKQRAELREAANAKPKGQMWPYLLVFSATLIALAGFVTVFLPQSGQLPGAVALAAPSTTAVPGQPGGLMPLGTVRNGLFDRPLRDFRPGVVAVLPSGSCPSCNATIASVWEQETAFGLPLLIVGSPGDEMRLTEFSATAGGSAAALDTRTLLPQGPVGHLTLYAIHSDGIIEAVVPAEPGTQIEPILRNLDQPGAGQSSAK
jgi:hypothetical protein